VDNADVQLAGVVVDDEKDVTQLETHWHDPFHPLSMPFNGSKSSFPASFSTASLSPTIRSSDIKKLITGQTDASYLPGCPGNVEDG